MPPYKRVGLGSSSRVGAFDFGNLSPKSSRRKKDLQRAMEDLGGGADGVGGFGEFKEGAGHGRGGGRRQNSAEDAIQSRAAGRRDRDISHQSPAGGTRQQPSMLKFQQQQQTKSYKRYISDGQRLPASALSKPASYDHYQMDQVLRCLYIGNQEDAQGGAALKVLGVTHVVNATKNLPNYHSGSSSGIEYFQVPVKDSPEEPIGRYFDDAAKFINRAINRERGVCLVHCVAGCSRSAAIVIAFLMYSERLLLKDAYDYTKKRRSSTQPNSGFMYQLAEYELKLHPGSSVVSAKGCWDFYEWNVRKKEISPSQYLKPGMNSGGGGASERGRKEPCCVVS